jgi:hypothetical protein
MRPQLRKCLEFFGLLAMLVGCRQSLAQTFVYVEPDNELCPVAAAPVVVPAKKVAIGSPVAGALRVSCGFTQGSYTVVLSATDPNAIFSPKTFLVNFGNLAGTGKFTVKFTTAGEQTISATITSNMGSPVLRGTFTSATHRVNVIRP